MKKFFVNIWEDDNFFLRVTSVLFMLAGYGFTANIIPTGVDGLGPKVGVLAQAISVGLATGKWQINR